MAHYNARLYTNRGVEIFDKKIECAPANIPDMLVCIVTDYLKDAHYPGAIKARVTDGRKYTEYLLLLENGIVDVYSHVEKAAREGGAGTAPAPADSNGLPDKEEDA